ncbi:unnamed protein product [Leptosia nina]|uniref:Uncharacterized protein n=1 Tax=Leptosia nina TaxID=320188 RepID=A0AAV1JPN9_9NEOP
MKFNSSGVGRLRSTSDRAGSRRDPARAVDASSSKPDVTPHTSATAADATADDATAATVAAEIAATPMPSFLDSIESHFLALSQGSPEVLDAMFRSLSGDVPPAPRGSPRALLYSDAIAYAIVRKQVAFSDGLNAAVRAYLDRTETELRAEGLLSTPLTQDESAVAYGNIARSTPLRRPRPESPSPPARDPKRPCQDATIPSFPEPLSQRDPRLRRRLALPVPEPAAPPAPAPRAAPVAPAAALAAPIAAPAVRSAHTPSAAPTSSAEPATTIDAPRSFAQLAAAPAAGRRPASPLPQTSTATTAAAAATPRYPPLIVEVLPEWTTHFRALRDRLGHAPNARPFGRGVRFSPKYGEEYRTVQRYLTELEKNQKVSWFSYSLPAERDFKVAIRGLPADTDPQLITKELKSRGFEPVHAQRIQSSQGGPGCLFLIILKRTPGLTPAIFCITELLCMPALTVEAWRGSNFSPGNHVNINKTLKLAPGETMLLAGAPRHCGGPGPVDKIVTKLSEGWQRINRPTFKVIVKYDTGRLEPGNRINTSGHKGLLALINYNPRRKTGPPLPRILRRFLGNTPAGGAPCSTCRFFGKYVKTSEKISQYSQNLLFSAFPMAVISRAVSAVTNARAIMAATRVRGSPARRGLNPNGARPRRIDRAVHERTAHAYGVPSLLIHATCHRQAFGMPPNVILPVSRQEVVQVVMT